MRAREFIITESKNLDRYYHGTRKDLDGFRPLTHFGTFRAAYDRLLDTNTGSNTKNQKIYQVTLDIKNPVELQDISKNHKLSDWISMMKLQEYITSEEAESISTPRQLIKLLISKGYDGINYMNEWEDPGSDSYVIFKPEQVKIKDVITFDQQRKITRLLKEVIKKSDTSKAEQWIKKVYSKLQPHPFTSGEYIMGLSPEEFAVIKLSPSKYAKETDMVYIDWFQAYPLGAGVGQKAMKILQKMAAEDDISLALHTWSKGKISEKSLVKFYKKQGFTPEKQGSRMIWRPTKQGVAEGASGMFSKVMGHETSPEDAKKIQQQGFKNLHTGIFFNTDNQNYSGGGYGGTVVMAKVSGPMDKILNLEDDNNLPNGLDEFADGEEIADYARSKGYWAWTDGVQFAVLDPKHTQVLKQGVAENQINQSNDLETIAKSFVNSPAGQKYRQHDCKTVTRAFVQWAEQNDIPTKVISLAPPSAEFIQKNPQFKGKSGEGDGHIMPVVANNAVDFTVRQFGINRPFEQPLITPVADLRSVYRRFGYFTDRPKWFLGGKESYWMGPLQDIPTEIFNQNFGDELLERGVAEGGAETSWSDGTEKITLQDILELTKHIKQINLPINNNLKSKLLHWDGNPEEIERINQVEVSKHFPILVMLDGQGQIDWILDGNHRLHKAINSQAKTIPAKLIKPSDLSDKAKRIFHIEERSAAENSGDTIEIPSGKSKLVKRTVPRYWYHSLHGRELGSKGEILPYKYGKETKIFQDELFRDPKPNGFVYLSPQPLASDSIKIDASKLDPSLMRLTGQVEGYAIYAGAIPAEAQVENES